MPSKSVKNAIRPARRILRSISGQACDKSLGVLTSVDRDIADFNLEMECSIYVTQPASLNWKATLEFPSTVLRYITLVVIVNAP